MIFIKENLCLLKVFVVSSWNGISLGGEIQKQSSTWGQVCLFHNYQWKFHIDKNKHDHVMSTKIAHWTEKHRDIVVSFAKHSQWIEWKRERFPLNPHCQESHSDQWIYGQMLTILFQWYPKKKKEIVSQIIQRHLANFLILIK